MVQHDMQHKVILLEGHGVDTAVIGQKLYALVKYSIEGKAGSFWVDLTDFDVNSTLIWLGY